MTTAEPAGAATTARPASRGQLAQRQTLNLRDCRALRSLPASLGQLERLQTLGHASEMLLSEEPTGAVVEALVRKFAALLNVEHSAVFMVDHEAAELCTTLATARDGRAGKIRRREGAREGGAGAE